MNSGREHFTIDPKKYYKRIVQQSEGTCYAYAITEMIYATHARNGLYKINRQQYLNQLISRYGSKGGKTAEILNKICKNNEYNCENLNEEEAVKALLYDRPILFTFKMCWHGWQDFQNFFSENPTGIFRQADMRPHKCHLKDIGHACMIIGTKEDSWTIKNSFGPDFGDNGHFRIQRSFPTMSRLDVTYGDQKYKKSSSTSDNEIKVPPKRRKSTYAKDSNAPKVQPQSSNFTFEVPIWFQDKNWRQ